MPRARPDTTLPWTMYVQGNRVLVAMISRRTNDNGTRSETTLNGPPLSARECVQLAAQLLACAGTIFAEQDANAPVEAPPEVPTGETVSPLAQGQAESLAARGLRPRRRR